MNGRVPAMFRDRRGLLLRLVLADVLAPPGEGPLAPRFQPRRRTFSRELTRQIDADTGAGPTSAKGETDEP